MLGFHHCGEFHCCTKIICFSQQKAEEVTPAMEVPCPKCTPQFVFTCTSRHYQPYLDLFLPFRLQIRDELFLVSLTIRI